MSIEERNKTIVERWFDGFWGKTFDPGVVDELAAPGMVLKHSLHRLRQGHAGIKTFMTDFRAAFPNLHFWNTAELIADGDTVFSRWEGGGTHTGARFDDFLMVGPPAGSRRTLHITGTSVLTVTGGKIVEEAGLDDGVTALVQLGLILHPLTPS
jgi:predicted ester cyclase